MEQDNKYYQPEVGDLRIGYQCEILDDWDNGNNPVYKPHTLKFEHGWIEIPERIVENLRTKYLDREDIESLGWADVRDVEMWGNREPAYHIGATLKNAMMGYNVKDHSIVITFRDPTKSIDGTEDEYNYPETKYGQFRGECKSKNELKLLMKWLKIK